jgi:hypothetical protein
MRGILRREARGGKQEAESGAVTGSGRLVHFAAGLTPLAR